MKRQLDAAEAAAAQKLSSTRLFKVVSCWAFAPRESLRRRGKRNDLVLHVLRTRRGTLIVQPPATLAGVQDVVRRPTADAPVFMYQIEMPRDPVVIGWERFRRKLATLVKERIVTGVAVQRDGARGVVRSRRGIEALQELWPDRERCRRTALTLHGATRLEFAGVTRGSATRSGCSPSC